MELMAPLALMEKVALMEKQLPMHQLLLAQVAFKGFKVHQAFQEISALKVKKVCAEKLVQLASKELLDQLACKARLD